MQVAVESIMKQQVSRLCQENREISRLSDTLSRSYLRRKIFLPSVTDSLSPGKGCLPVWFECRSSNQLEKRSPLHKPRERKCCCDTTHMNSQDWVLVVSQIPAFASSHPVFLGLCWSGRSGYLWAFPSFSYFIFSRQSVKASGRHDPLLRQRAQRVR